MQPQKKSRSWLVALAVIGGVLLFGVVMWGIAIGFETETTAEERAMLPTVASLGVIDGKERTGGTYTKTRYLDGTWTIEYEYEDPELYMLASIGHEHNERDARTVFTGGSAATSVGIAIAADVDLEEDASLYRGGDQQSCNRIVTAGQTAGYIVSVRDGTDVISLLVGGIVYDDAPTVLAEILDPMLGAL